MATFKQTSLLVTVFLVLVCLTIPQEQVEGAKKLKKAAKEIAKELIYSKLTSRKNFFPIPLPIPGKWQQVANLLADSTGEAIAAAIGASDNQKGFRYSGSRPSNQGSSSAQDARGFLNSKRMDLRKSLAVYSGSGDSAGKKLLLFGASNMVGSLSNIDMATGGKLTKLAKLIGANSLKPILAAPPPIQSSASLEIKNIKKMTRFAAAIYAKRIISQEASKPHKRPTRSSDSVSGLAKKAIDNNKRHDALVTAFNVVKLAQQIRQISPRKMLQNYKKSSFTPGFASEKVPFVSMNINNRKTFLNKMLYIHKLTSNLHNKHRKVSSVATNVE